MSRAYRGWLERQGNRSPDGEEPPTPTEEDYDRWAEQAERRDDRG